MATLPRPDVSVTTRSNPVTGGTDLDVVISRDGKARSYTGTGAAPVKDVVEKILADPMTGEWLPAGKRY